MIVLLASVERRWPDYRAVWRWHFYAGLYCIPFILLLSVSGVIYLFKSEIEAWQDRPYDQLQRHQQAVPASEQIAAAVAAVPGSRWKGYELPVSEQSAARVLVSLQGQGIRVYVHPETLEILHQVPEEVRLMRIVRRLHGELLLGPNGSYLVELAACWTLVMILTGLYLWWPRNLPGWGGILYPRVRHSGKIFWRDMHSVTGIWISTLVIFLIVSGLPWSKFWGEYFKTLRTLTHTAVARQDWSTGNETPRGEHSSHEGHQVSSGRESLSRSSRTASESSVVDYTTVDRIAATVIPLKLPAPVIIEPPARGETTWSAKSMTANRPQRVTLQLDATSGAVVSRENFRDRHLVDRIVGTGIALHEGQLFGWPNQALGVLTALGLLVMSLSGLVLWWRRRHPGELGAPPAGHPARFSMMLTLSLLCLAIFMPLFGATLVGVLLLEWGLLSRIPGVRTWLGLRGCVPRQARGEA